jgi:hypothetical protein
MTCRHAAPAVLVAALLVTVALPAVAQPACPTPIPGTPRAGIACVPLAGGGVATQSTCTFYGDVEWLLQNIPVDVPPGTCSVLLTFPDANWTSSPTNTDFGGDLFAGFCFSEAPLGDPEFQTCNVPATSTRGLATLIVVLAAFGGFILWRRAG